MHVNNDTLTQFLLTPDYASDTFFLTPSMKRPELIVFDEAGKPNTFGNLLETAFTLPVLNLYWPVESLPERMGWLNRAEQLPDDRMRRYFQPLETNFTDEKVVVWNYDYPYDTNVPYEEIDYDELQHLIGETGAYNPLDRKAPAKLELYCHFNPASYDQEGPTRRLRAELRVINKRDQRRTEETETIPF